MLWNKEWRENTWQSLDQDWDLIIIGGGATGAGVFREAVNRGYHCLLLEANDFAFGTSSRSSKMIHGGFRYLANRQFDVTHESVLEREWMLREAKNLVSPLQFLIPIYQRRKAVQLQVGVVIYDWMAKVWKHRTLSKKRIKKFCPLLRQDGLHSGITYFDAQMDDCRFVLRLIRESVMAGGTALNYARVTSLRKDVDGNVCGVKVVDASQEGCTEQTQTLDLHARVVVNAAGPWSDEIRAGMAGGDKIRQLRGSHLVFPAEKFPLDHAITLYHPDDHRAMFALPWEGATLIGTTDLDHPYGPGSPGNEPWCTIEEIEYMLHAIKDIFPGVDVSHDDIISSMAGLRPIISSGKENPSDESRAHAIWVEDGMVSVGGGKITIFRIMARDVMASVEDLLGEKRADSKNQRYFNRLPERLVMNDLDCVDVKTMNYLSGRYGLEIGELVNTARIDECIPIEPLPNVWAELRWTVKAEAVVHLDDLLLRRVRLGLLLPNAAEEHMPQIRTILQDELGWSDAHWEYEYRRYREIWQQAYSPYPADLSKRRNVHEQA